MNAAVPVVLASLALTTPAYADTYTMGSGLCLTLTTCLTGAWSAGDKNPVILGDYFATEGDFVRFSFDGEGLIGWESITLDGTSGDHPAIPAIAALNGVDVTLRGVTASIADVDCDDPQDPRGGIVPRSQLCAVDAELVLENVILGAGNGLPGAAIEVIDGRVTAKGLVADSIGSPLVIRATGAFSLEPLAPVVELVDSVFSGNSQVAVVQAKEGTIPFRATGCKLTGNGGVGFYFDGVDAEIYGSVFEGNASSAIIASSSRLTIGSRNDGDLARSAFVNNANSPIFSFGGELTVQATDFLGNSGPYSGGLLADSCEVVLHDVHVDGAYQYDTQEGSCGGFATVFDGSLFVEDSTVSGAHSVGGGGAICVGSTSTARMPVQLTNVDFQDTTAPYGGAIFAGAVDLSFDDLTFQATTARTDLGGGAGGALFLHQSTVEGTGLRVEDGVADFGGALFLEGGAEPAIGPYPWEGASFLAPPADGDDPELPANTIRDVLVLRTPSNTEVVEHGGAFVVHEAHLALVDADLQAVTARGAGGGFLVFEGELEWTGGTATDVAATGGESVEDALGGLIVAGDSNVWLTDVDVFGSTAGNGGGVVFAYQSALTWTGGTIGPDADSGAYAPAGGAFLTVDSQVTLADLVVRETDAQAAGVGAFVRGTLDVSECLFEDVGATANPSAFLLADLDSWRLFGTTVCHAGSPDADVVQLWGSARESALIHASAFVENGALRPGSDEAHGADVRLMDSEDPDIGAPFDVPLRVWNVTFLRSHQPDGAIQVQTGNASIANDLFVGNPAAVVVNGGAVDGGYNGFWENGLDVPGHEAWPGPNDVVRDPDLVGDAVGSCEPVPKVAEDSPARGAGDPDLYDAHIRYDLGRWLIPGIDADLDGYSAGPDCDDTDPAIHPGVAEIWNNGRDDDCDGNEALAWVSGACGCRTPPSGAALPWLVALAAACLSRRRTPR